MTGEYQNELFGEFKKEKGKFEKIADKIRKRQKAISIHVPLENIVILAISVIMFIILAFALGVERGKWIALPVTQKEEQKVDEKIEETLPVIEKEKEIEEKKDIIHPPYTIQLISYKQKSFAEKERDKLLSKNIDAFIISAENWYQVCAGNFETVKEAKPAMEQFTKEYKSCFIRKR